jgi:hypothetical protein
MAQKHDEGEERQQERSNPPGGLSHDAIIRDREDITLWF